MEEFAYIRKDGKFLIASINRPWSASGGVDSPSSTERGLAKKCDIHAYYNLLETHVKLISCNGFSYFHHAAERFWGLEKVACPFEKGASNITTDPQLSVGIGLECFINAVDTVTCILNFKMLSLEHRDT